MKVNFNGKIFSSDLPILKSNNRAFLYGDAIFETLRMFEGKLPFLENHINRMLKTLAFLKYSVPKKYSAHFFKKEIKKIASDNSRIRITVFRSDGGLYTPKNLRPNFLITSQPLKSSQFILNKEGLTLGIFDEVKLSQTPLSPFKTCNALPYILAGIYKKEQNLDDCILLNEKDRISEAISSNIFLFKKNKLITPSLSEGCVSGTMRSLIFKIASEENIIIQEKKISLSSLNSFEEIWLTNAINGIQWVSKIGGLPPLSSPKCAPSFVHKINLKIHKPY